MRSSGTLLLILSLFLFSIAKAMAPMPSSFAPNFYKTQTQVFHFKDVRGDDVQVLVSHLQVPRTDLPKFFAAIPKNSKESVLFSYDEKLIAPVLDKTSEVFLPGKKNYFLPLSVTESIQKSAQHMKESIANDRIGLFVVAVNTAYDSFLWMHADALGAEQKTAMVLFNLVIAASFGLDKDLWANMTQPLENRVSKMLDKLAAGHKELKFVAATFTSNMVFSVALQGIRLSILSYPNLLDSMMTTQFWGTSIVMGSLITMTSFGWSEQMADVDSVKNPVAKGILRRFSEIRSFMMGQLAPSSKILQSDIYGITPIVVTVVHGAIGIWTMLNADKIVEKIEGSVFFQKLNRANQKFDSWIQQKYETAKVVTRKCADLFKPQTF